MYLEKSFRVIFDVPVSYVFHMNGNLIREHPEVGGEILVTRDMGIPQLISVWPVLVCYGQNMR